MATTPPNLTPQEAIIYLMIMASAVDGSINPSELRTIGRVVRTFPVFTQQHEEELVAHAEQAGQLMGSDGGLHKVIDAAHAALPEHLIETAYAAVVDVVTADESLNLEEIRILELVREKLGVTDEGAAAIEHAARARHMTMEAPV
ncbi:tellurite resistance TerB family protein [Parvularcula sp. ZS-1/3]|uniref:Tellurite resistance TerB family protein n=1 Tax=Parvularcula mediterranea TaxID=2732508 RepID=A0A7Y3W617_9PROT|nr:tellurite resistance TerB family protein [Parvularcula mediterranea]NNU17214.1 tellurite resistance TerB family protein [Parvularcula mediterranea]